MGKRPTLKGKGVDIFFEEKKKTNKEKVLSKKEKGTYYLPPSLLTSLDNIWFIIRKNNRKIKKSDIVKFALEEAVSSYEKEGKQSKLFKHFTSEIV